MFLLVLVLLMLGPWLALRASTLFLEVRPRALHHVVDQCSRASFLLDAAYAMNADTGHATALMEDVLKRKDKEGAHGLAAEL